MPYESEKQIAIQAVQAAAQLCEQVRREIVPEAIEKKDKSPVTVADFGAQALICRALSTAFPQDAVVGEEDAAELRTPEMAERLAQVTQYVQAIVPDATAEQVTDWIDHGNGQVASRYWTLDPIDGTKGFLRGDQYAIALALIEDGEIKVGVLGCPALSFTEGQTGLMGVAVRGAGATLSPLAGGTPQSIQVVSAEQSDNLRFVESVESGHGDQSRQAAVAKAAGITQDSLRMDSQAKYMAVAAGEAALYLRLPSPKTPDYREKIWDHAAGVILVEESGGRVTDIAGKSLDFSLGAKLVNNQGVVVSNGSIHDPVLAAL
ncbi:3'(2'),5'-bisphosphate nucleotidase [Acaryochloris sp. 'Moss Beach']|uniref:3'(2'),5'-bisphosphate nucleotidase n=1 Tax=Acaryochloris sp. 'Moss Beach' TaxID=2740837 RepID=UPI001F1F3BD1|nr:3'(2'),5'-bisphosphate nucleotidase [Acaryochloris sp. 'Moss Beach']UJB67951.1 3'(2'),5'-bisphosphate nucleotidase [Acaryochloris sp. 'Moss Beach']